MRIRSWQLGLIVLILIFGGIGISSAAGYWQTTNTKVPAKYTTGEFAGEYNPADIRGSYTFGDISSAFDLPLDDLAKAFGITDANPADFQVKNLESMYVNTATGQSVGTSSVRIFVAFYKGLPIDLSTGDYLLPEAAAMLKQKATLSAEQINFLDSHIFGKTESSTTPATSPSPTPTSTHTATVSSITGKTTFQDLLDWGVSQQAIEGVIKEALPSKSLVIKDYAAQKGLEFSTLRTELQALIDAVK